MPKYLKDIPKPLQEDFADGRVLPFVGAGFSKNAILPPGMSMPDWNELGKQVAEYINDYEYITANAIDALSLFESTFSRVKLVEMLTKKLCINDLKPGETHRSFCNLFYDTICTTNFDFLLEHTLQETKRPHSIIISEDGLPINAFEKTKLIKLHGDFNHPERMVITEHDFDDFLEKNKVLATYISNLFITKTLFLVGYSFEDNDLRGLWQIINNRLGYLHQPAYTVMVDASPVEISRFKRRNVNVINLKGNKTDYPKILNQFFIEIKEMIDEKSPSKITATNEKIREELILPDSDKRLCFISAPTTRIAFLKQLIYPILNKYSITPITLNEVIMPGENWMTKSETLLKEASLAVVDLSGNNDNVLWELGIMTGLKKNLLIIVDKSQSQAIPSDLMGVNYLIYSTESDNEKFILRLDEQLSTLFQTSYLFSENEPDRLLHKNEFDAAVISAFRLLESTLHKYNDTFRIDLENRTPLTLWQMLKILRDSNIPQDQVLQAINFLNVRNQIVHSEASCTNKKDATKIVKTINSLIDIIKRDGIVLNNT